MSGSISPKAQAHLNGPEYRVPVVPEVGKPYIDLPAAGDIALAYGKAYRFWDFFRTTVREHPENLPYLTGRKRHSGNRFWVGMANKFTLYLAAHIAREMAAYGLPATDENLYQVRDRWVSQIARYLAKEIWGGDCEDWMVTFLEAMIRWGVKTDRLWMCAARGRSLQRAWVDFHTRHETYLEAGCDVHLRMRFVTRILVYKHPDPDVPDVEIDTTDLHFADHAVALFQHAGKFYMVDVLHPGRVLPLADATSQIVAVMPVSQFLDNQGKFNEGGVHDWHTPVFHVERGAT